jgi:hypothetical protein
MEGEGQGERVVANTKKVLNRAEDRPNFCGSGCQAKQTCSHPQPEKPMIGFGSHRTERLPDLVPNQAQQFHGWGKFPHFKLHIIEATDIFI